MVICLQRGADLHMAQLIPLPLTVSCFSKIQIGLTFLVPAHLGSPGKGPLNGCVCALVLSKCLKQSALIFGFQLKSVSARPSVTMGCMLIVHRDRGRPSSSGGAEVRVQ